MTRQTQSAQWTSSGALEAVRPQVRDTLMAIPAFGEMTDDERRELAANMVKVLSYIADPNAVVSEASTNQVLPKPPAAARAPLAGAQAEDPVEATKRQLSKDPGVIGKEFEAGAVKQGVEQFGELVQKVDFPKFVGGLIQNVFQAI